MQIYCPDLASDALSVWNFCNVSLTSFCRETSGYVAICQLYSQVNRLSGINLIYHVRNNG